MILQFPILLVVLAFVLLNVISQYFYKIGMQAVSFSDGLAIPLLSIVLIAIGVLGQIAGLSFWLILIKLKDLYWAGMMATLIPISIVLTGRFIFGERINNASIVGIIIVVIGLVIVNFNSLSDSISKEDNTEIQMRSD